MWLTDWVKEFFRKADMVLLALILAASLFGVVLIYSATRFMELAGARFVPIQLAAIVLGVVAYFIMSFVDVELFTEKSWKWMFGFNIFILLLLLTPFGVGAETTGNNSWLAFPFLPVNIQPAEVAKVFFVLLLALQCRNLQDWGISRFTSVVQLAGHTLFMAGLIAVISGDFGMVLVYLFLSLAVRDPVPMVDELLAASVLSVLCFTLIRRRAAGGALYRNIMLSCRRELGILREDEDEAIGRLEDYYESLCRYDIQAMADILAHRGGENPPPFRGELTEGLSAALRQYAVKDDPRCWHYMKMLAGNRPDRRLGAILVQSALSDGLDLCLLYILCQLIPR